MADQKLTELTTLPAIDRSTDLLYIVDMSAGTSNKATVNFILGISGSPVGTSDVQELTGKTLTQPTIVVDDASFTLQDNSDTTKKLKFQLSGITTGTTRTLTVPDATDTLVTLTATQTLTNKTLTSPAINTPTIVNPTITVDTISEYTSANGVVIDGLTIKDNALVGAVITRSNLSTAAGEIGAAWQSWTPTFVNVTVGNGTLSAKYLQVGKRVDWMFTLTLGSTSSIGSNPTFTKPVTSASYTANFPGAMFIYIDASAGSNINGTAFSTSTSIFQFISYAVAGALISSQGLSSTSPFTWTTSDVLAGWGTYEAA